MKGNPSRKSTGRGGMQYRWGSYVFSLIHLTYSHFFTFNRLCSTDNLLSTCANTFLYKCSLSFLFCYLLSTNHRMTSLRHMFPFLDHFQMIHLCFAYGCTWWVWRVVWQSDCVMRDNFTCNHIIPFNVNNKKIHDLKTAGHLIWRDQRPAMATSVISDVVTKLLHPEVFSIIYSLCIEHFQLLPQF